MPTRINFDESPELFTTSDLGLASALVAFGHELHMIIKDGNSNKSQFTFRRDATIERDITAFWNDNLRINARSYFDAIRLVKNRLHSN